MKDRTTDLFKVYKQKDFSYLKLILCIIAFIFTIIFQIRNPQNSNIVQGTISQLQVLLSVIMVIMIAKKGYIAAIIINAMQSIVNTIRIIASGDVSSMLGVIIPIITMIIISILSFFIQLLNKKVKVITEAQNEISKQNEKLKQYNETLKENEIEIEKMAYNDHLTGLPNRRMFSAQLKGDIDKSLRTNIPLSILFIDMDSFKMVNDSIGHDNGDKLLVKVAKRLKKTVRKSDLVSRIGGDEFSVILYNPCDYKSISLVCQHIIDAFKEPFYLDEHEVRITVSIGVAVFQLDGIDDDTLLKNADIAMYNAKEKGKGRYAFYSEAMEVGQEEIMRLTNDLYRALENDELEVYYQPQVLASTREITGFEALLRWNHPRLGLIMPGKFISIAESTGLIIPIGNWVLKTASLQIVNWNKRFNKKLKMAVNLSVKQLESRQIVEDVKMIISDTTVDPELIEFEITESSLMKDINNTIEILTELKELNVNISIDDFGSEYSSLNYIKHMPVSRIKIPKGFVDGIKHNKSDESIITSTIMLAKELGMNVVAEGVEQHHQYSYLRDSDCGYIQGYFFHKPMTAKNIEFELKK